MKATLTFDLPEDEEHHENALHGWRYALAIWEYDQWLREKLKYEELPEAEYDIYEKCRDRLREIINENDASGVF